MSRRVKRHYDETFKLQVLSEYYSSGMSKDFIARKYDLGDRCHRDRYCLKNQTFWIKNDLF